MEARQGTPPIIPIQVTVMSFVDVYRCLSLTIALSQTDPELAENFDSKFTKELPVESPIDIPSPLSASYSDFFQGFSYVAKHNHLDAYCN